MQEIPHNDGFSPEGIDEQIAQIIQDEHKDIDKAHLIEDLQRAYQEEREEQQASERIYERLTAYAEGKLSQGMQEEQRLAEESQPSRQGRKHPMETQKRYSHIYTMTRQLATIAAVLIAALIIGSLVVVLNMAHTHNNGDGTATLGQKQHQAGEATPPEMYLGVNNQVVKVDKQTGKVLWRFTVPSTSGIPSSVIQVPVVADGSVYFTGQDDKLYALNALTGKQRWVQNFRYYIGSQYFVNGVLYVGVSSTDVNGAIYALNPVDGTIEKTYKAAGGIGEILGIFDSVMYFKNGTDHVLAALNLKNDHPLWQTTLDAKQSWNGEVYVRNGVLYASSGHYSYRVVNPPQDSYVYTLDIHSGKITWQSPMINGFVWHIAVDDNGRIYCGAYDNYVYAFDPKMNRQLWRYHTLGDVNAAPIVQNGVVYIGQASVIDPNSSSRAFLTAIPHPTNEHLIALDAATGTPKWIKQLNGYVGVSDIEPLVLYDNVIYLSTRSGVQGFSISTGDNVVTIPAKTLQENMPESSILLTMVSIAIR